MRISYPTNYSGYVPILRGMFLLVKTGVLTFSELSAYIYFTMQADFDKRHNHYTTVLRDDRELAKEFGINSSTIYRYRKALIKKGLLLESEGLTKIANYHLFELEHVKKLAKFAPANLQNLFAKSVNDCVSFENMIADLQGEQPQKDTHSSNVSSKDGRLSEEDEEWIRANLRV